MCEASKEPEPQRAPVLYSDLLRRHGLMKTVSGHPAPLAPALLSRVSSNGTSRDVEVNACAAPPQRTGKPTGNINNAIFSDHLNVKYSGNVYGGFSCIHALFWQEEDLNIELAQNN